MQVGKIGAVEFDQLWVFINGFTGGGDGDEHDVSSEAVAEAYDRTWHLIAEVVDH